MDANGNVDDDFNAGLLAKKDDTELGKRVEEIGITLVQFQDMTGRIKNFLNKIEFYQSMMRSYEHRDFAIVNANMNRISFWSIIFTVSLLLVSVIQVYTIRSLFEQNSKIGKALRR
jgi:protein ERP2